MTTRPKPWRIQRILKWTGVVAGVLLLGVYWTSAHFHGIWFNRTGTITVLIANGRISLFHSSIATNIKSESGWMIFGAPLVRYAWSFSHTVAPGRMRNIIVPLWAPFLLMSAVTAVLFYLDHCRIPPGHCRHCGYDLTGNVSGRCSECGTVV